MAPFTPDLRSRATDAPQPEFGPDTPLRLAQAAAAAFPGGGMTARGLRREAARGRLVIERVAGKDYTTLAAIKRMRELCRVAVKVRDSGCAAPAATGAAASATPPSGSLSTAAISKARAAGSTIAAALSARSPTTSPASTSIRRRKGNVIPLQSR